MKINSKHKYLENSNGLNLPILPWHYFIPLYCIFISLLLFVSRDLSAAQASPIAISNIHRVICIPTSIAYTLLYFLTYKKFRKPNFALRLFFYYIAIGLISSFLFSSWFLYSIWKLLEIIAVLLTAMYAWSLEFKYQGTLIVFYKKTITFFRFILLSVLASIIIMPNAAIQKASTIEAAFLPIRISGPLININSISVGIISAFISYIIIIKYIYNKNTMTKFDACWFTTSIILLVFAQSRTAIAGFSIAVILLIILTKQTNLFIKMCLLCVGFAACYIFSTEILNYLQRGQSVQGLYSLTGRFTWWEFAYNKMLHSDFLHKLFGYGFGIGDRLVALQSSGDRMQTLDSTFMSCLVSTGFLGTIIIIILFVYTIVKLFLKRKENKIFVEIFGINIIILIKAITTTTINVFTFYSFIFIISATIAGHKFKIDSK